MTRMMQKIGCTIKISQISEFQNHPQTKSNLHIYIAQSWFKKPSLPWLTLYVVRNDHQVRCLIQLVRMWYVRNAGKKLFSPTSFEYQCVAPAPTVLHIGIFAQNNFQIDNNWISEKFTNLTFVGLLCYILAKTKHSTTKPLNSIFFLIF